MEDRRYRLGHRQGDRWVAYRHAATFEAGDRVIAGIPSSDPGVLQSLVSLLRGPLRLLYVLHTPRGEAAAGRYESPEISVEQTSLFIRRFSDFLAADGRFDLWVHSATEHAALVWDRHDQLFGYGPVDLFVSRLR